MAHFLILLAALSAADDPLTFRVAKDGRVDVVLQLTAATAQKLKANSQDRIKNGGQWLTLSALDAKGSPGPPVFSRYLIEGRKLVLRPRYRLMPGVTYLATARTATEKMLTRRFKAPDLRSQTAPRVVRIFPESRQLPANCLKFYLHFDQPMREGREIFEQILLLNNENEVISAPWRRIELWNADATRLTIWIHPGRIKQGVNLREEQGPVLRPGKTYRLVVTPLVCGANGIPLEKAFEKKFTAIEEDHHRPLPQRWRIRPPGVGTRAALRVDFGKSLDHALIQRWLTVRRGRELIDGEIEPGKDDRSWSFRPNQPWRTGAHQLDVDGRLEDLAGNTPLRVFDTDLDRPDSLSEAPRLTIPFKPW